MCVIAVAVVSFMREAIYARPVLTTRLSTVTSCFTAPVSSRRTILSLPVGNQLWLQGKKENLV
jgi:hypothetical protein